MGSRLANQRRYDQRIVVIVRRTIDGKTLGQKRAIYAASMQQSDSCKTLKLFDINPLTNLGVIVPMHLTHRTFAILHCNNRRQETLCGVADGAGGLRGGARQNVILELGAQRRF